MTGDEWPRITDASVIEPEDIKGRNHRFFKNPDHPYDVPADFETFTQNKIGVVRNGDLNRVIRGLPKDVPVHQQCALWVRALVGKHFFPDANHRTAMLTLWFLLDENGIDPPNWPGEQIANTVYNSKVVRRDIEIVTLDNLWERDELHAVWCQHFVRMFDP